MKQIKVVERGVERMIPIEGEVLPPVRHIPNVVDPYAASMPTVQQTVKYEATPITRAQAMRMKIRDITLFLGVMTAAAMYAFQLYPASWQAFGITMLWLLIVCSEGLATFVVLAILDYRETPAAQNRQQMNAYIAMMEREQKHRLRAQYPEQFRRKNK